MKIEMATPGLYEIVGTYGAAIDGCCRVTAAESENELIFAYGELGNMMPVDVGKEVAFSGRLHCLADAGRYSQLSGDDMDIDVQGCLVYGTGGDYNTGALALWQAYQDNKDL